MKKELSRLVLMAVVLVAVAGAGAYWFSMKQKADAAAVLEARLKTAPAALDPVFVRPHSHALGPKDAKVTVVEFLDPECETCRQLYPVVKHLLALYPNQVRLVVRYMPLHPNSIYAAGALEAAAEQGRYWEMLEKLFLNQPQWGDHHKPRPELIPDYAQELGLDMNAWNQAVNSPAHKEKVAIDQADGKTLGVTGTPTFFVNGKPVELGLEPLRAAIDAELAK